MQVPPSPATTETCPPPPPERACTPVSDERLLPSGGGRLCALDVGSKNVKLTVASLVPGQAGVVDGERSCKTAMNLRTKVADPATGAARPLAPPDLEALVAQLETYAAICARDEGRLVAAVATEWARRVTNVDEVKRRIRRAVGLDLRVLSGEEEGAYGYAAAAHGGGDRIVLEAGSASFQLTFRGRGDGETTAISLPLGHEVAGERVWLAARGEGYRARRRAYEDEVRRLLAAEPARAASFARLRRLVATGLVDRELVSLGDSGVILALEGVLRDGAGRWADGPTYVQRLDERRRALMHAPWPKRTLSVPSVEAFLSRLETDDAAFDGLLGPCVRPVYGAKVLGHLSLIAFLARELQLAPRVLFSSGDLAEAILVDTRARRNELGR